MLRLYSIILSYFNQCVRCEKVHCEFILPASTWAASMTRYTPRPPFIWQQPLPQPPLWRSWLTPHSLLKRFLFFIVFFLKFFCLPQLYLWGSPFRVRFLCMWPFLFFFFFFNPTVEVVTFHVCEWCMLGLFLLPPFTCLGHECQDLLSLCDRMHVCTD